MSGSEGEQGERKGSGMAEYTGPATVQQQPRLKDKTNATMKRGPLDLPFLLLTLLLLTIGVVMVLSASFARAYDAGKSPTYYFIRQLVFAASGVVLMLIVSFFPVRFFRYMSRPLMLLSLVMLALVPYLGTGQEEVGSNRWFDLGFTTFQPSEIAKVAVILFLATMICIYRDKMKTFKYGVIPFVVVLGLVVFLLVLEPHISASVIIIAVGAIMMFAGGTKWQYFAVVITVAGIAGVIVVTKMPYVSSRITIWLDPFSDPRDKGFQIIQSLYAIGSGGLLGLGLGQGRQKYLYLPEEHNDFIFSVVCEELGLVGALLILALFALLIIRGYWLALHARDRFGALVIIGIVSLLALQVILNVSVVTNLLPCTGISLPFFSYGGTALWIQLVEVGIVLSISRDIPLRKQRKEEQ